MIVVSDTSPLNYLVLIGQEELLPKLFGRVIIPQIVFDELKGYGAPTMILEWIENLPAWVEIQQTNLIAAPSLDILDKGERDAILLAQELSADLVLLDDRQARNAALDLGLTITGTVGVLDKASRAGLIDLRLVLKNLQNTNFYVANELIDKLLADSQKLS